MNRIIAILVLLFCSCFAARAANAEAPSLVFIPEMEELPLARLQTPAETLAPVPASAIEAFRLEWRTAAEDLEPLITVPLLVYLSRWARKETATAHLEPGWIKTLPMKPAGILESRRVLFSQEISEGCPLPSHSPLVFRRLLFFAEFDAEKKKIVRLIITIRGWREE